MRKKEIIFALPFLFFSMIAGNDFSETDSVTSATSGPAYDIDVEPPQTHDFGCGCTILF